jgi:hypothetical protein
MIRFDGNTPEDIELWHTYLFWARSRVCNTEVADSKVIADDPANRVDFSTGDALQAILFCSFTLEYRMKRVLLSMGCKLPKKETLGPLYANFWPRLEKLDRLDKAGKCKKPVEWKKCADTLDTLVSVRSAIAHANYEETIGMLSATRDPTEMARKYYNALIDAIMLINISTGYNTGPFHEVKEYFKHLKC